jgi:hypothetical protein
VVFDVTVCAIEDFGELVSKALIHLVVQHSGHKLVPIRKKNGAHY